MRTYERRVKRECRPNGVKERRAIDNTRRRQHERGEASLLRFEPSCFDIKSSGSLKSMFDLHGGHRI